MTEAALALLPPRRRARWRRAGPDLVREYCIIPDRFYGDRPKYHKYCALPNGRLVPHALTNEALDDFPSFTRAAPDYEQNLYVARYYLGKVTALLKRGNDAEAARFAGTLAHHLQDSVWPCHAIHNSLLPVLLPFPRGKYWHLHRALDDIQGLRPGDLMSVRPVLLGETVREAAYNLVNATFNAVRASLGLVVPMVQAIYRGHPGRKDRLLRQAAREGARLTASAWHTAFSLAAGRFARNERALLKVVHLGDIPPFNRFTLLGDTGEPLDLMSHDPYMFEPLADHTLRVGSSHSAPMVTAPLSLRVRRNGRIAVQTFPRGFGAAGTSRITFRVDGAIHRTFRATFGCHPALSQSDGKVVFKVLVGPTAETLRAAFESVPMVRGGEAQTVDLKLGRQTRYLRLATEGKLTDGVQIVWADPVLVH